MLFDTDILIWLERKNVRAADMVDRASDRSISIQTYMELVQGLESKRSIALLKDFLRDCEFKVLPLTENIGHRASIYMEEYSLGHGLHAADALIAATATEHGLVLATANGRHFRPIRDLSIHLFKP